MFNKILSKTMQTTNDPEIRAYLHALLQKKYHKKPNTLIIDEFSLEHGKNRADIVTIDNYIHGYEIKSSKDNLIRLPDQLSQYKDSLQKVSFLVAENHLNEVLQTTPEWCGVFLVRKGPRGGIKSTCIRKGKLNPDVDFIKLAHVLWKSEAVNILNKYGVTAGINHKTRKDLYKELSSIITIQQLTKEIKLCLVERGDWKAEKLQLSYDG